MWFLPFIAVAIIGGTFDTIDRANNYEARIIHIEKAIERAENGKKELMVNMGRYEVKLAKTQSKIARKTARLNAVKRLRDHGRSKTNNRRVVKN